jgi:hypothetical protein
MRNWGIVISVFYAVIVLVILVPVAVLLSGASENTGWSGCARAVHDAFGEGLIWVIIAILLISQALLLFLSVDKSPQKLKPRTHLWISCLVAAALTALLAWGIYLNLGVGIYGEKFLNGVDSHVETGMDLVKAWGVLWFIWALVFYLYLRNKSDVVNRVIAWLLKGSVLELLIAVPCHVIVRRREHCCAPIVTSFGIATGMAIMLLSFGPSVLFLCKKRMEGYGRAKSGG